MTRSTLGPALDLTLTGARVLRPDGFDGGALSVSGGVIADAPAGRQVDLSDCLVLPGLIDVHGDGFERHMAPRRGALREAANGVIATAAELAVNGITTGVMAQFFSWEGGLRSPEFAASVFDAVGAARHSLPIDLHLQLRLETHMMDDFPQVLDMVAAHDISYVVLNDHLPHKRLSEGRKPPRLTGQALKSGRSPEKLLALMQGLHARTAEVPEAVAALCQTLTARGVRLGSHDDHTAKARANWRAMGVHVSEFPETSEAAVAARQGGDAVVLGAPNVVRGASHAGNASATELVREGLCDALASDYHYPAMRQAVWRLVDQDILRLEDAWALVSSGPARVLGLTDRGALEDGKRADILVLEADTRRVGAVISGGHIAYLTGRIAARFLA
ncbi:alpha-D-ribose 1-methylphosphonate 5-triphosphate diphosphatase [Primorskyibacter marinus]|uniref:alpha-D-ribose 1-methylphosphonate 5-triphosphate diphosphatase n=1 Tax=Primorskyibacter marinus TaxID=1977320 RepID=UPI000E301B2B|nr:alpha-D-ribose 1-methylphosphonate 5-triphosphate diphosphatase [Primorskyibacter marinus]